MESLEDGLIKLGTKQGRNSVVVKL